LELLSNFKVGFEALLDVSLSLVVLSLLKVITQCQQRVLCLLKPRLSSPLIQPLLLLKLYRRLYLAGRGVSRYVEEIDVRLQVALLQYSNALGFSCHLFLKLEIVFFAKVGT